MKKINLLIIVAAVAAGSMGFIAQQGSNVKVGLEVGNKAPELKFNDPAGKPIALSSFKGKIVLIDFWASWCRPCRMENPNVVAAYNKYKVTKFNNAKGFIIYSVSLDANLDAWKAAIAGDQLSWNTHVSDLKQWASEPAAIYGVQSIPTNFLLNANGIIVAKNLRGPALDAELDKLLKR